MSFTAWEVGKTYPTKGGQSARVVCVDRKSTYSPVVVLIDGGEYERIETRLANGKYLDDGRDHDYDLIPPVETRTGWIVVYPEWESSDDATIYASEEGARRVARKPLAVKQITYTFTLGEGL